MGGFFFFLGGSRTSRFLGMTLLGAKADEAYVWHELMLVVGEAGRDPGKSNARVNG